MEREGGVNGSFSLYVTGDYTYFRLFIGGRVSLPLVTSSNIIYLTGGRSLGCG